jgi:hypothetical protein
MKVRDYLSANIELWSVEVSDSLIDAELINVGLNGDSEYEPELEVKTNTLFYNLIPKLLLAPKRVSEGQFTIEYDKDAMLAYYRMIADQLGLPNNLERNKIRDRSNIW